MVSQFHFLSCFERWNSRLTTQQDEGSRRNNLTRIKEKWRNLIEPIFFIGEHMKREEMNECIEKERKDESRRRWIRLYLYQRIKQDETERTNIPWADWTVTKDETPYSFSSPYPLWPKGGKLEDWMDSLVPGTRLNSVIRMYRKESRNINEISLHSGTVTFSYMTWATSFNLTGTNQISLLSLWSSGFTP